MSWTRRDRRALSPALEDARLRIEALARAHGLDFFDTIFEMCDYDEINMVAAYGGFPTRYPHWRWGMDYLSMQKGYEYGLQKIYEMVINTDPAYAYLLDNNAIVDQKLVMAHVFGHVDFFKNNAWFAHTDRKMLDGMANHASRVRRIADRIGETTVEQWIDVCSSFDNLIDPYLDPHAAPRSAPPSGPEDGRDPHRFPARPYMDTFINPPEVLEQARARAELRLREARRTPEQPVRDVMGFVLAHGRMERWQSEILSILREEAYYFAPQAQTKIMNEGWASYWHTRLMTDHVLDDTEVVDYCDRHSGAVAMRGGQLNPYKLGLELFRDIEHRWDHGRFGPEWDACDDAAVRRDWDVPTRRGRERIFEVRRTHNDVTFLDTFLTEDFCRRAGLFTYGRDRKTGEPHVDSRAFRDVKRKLLFLVGNQGQPRVSVTDANHANRGELELTHAHEGVDVQLDWAAQVLCNLSLAWGRPVHLRTRVEEKEVVLKHDGTAMTRS